MIALKKKWDKLSYYKPLIKVFSFFGVITLAMNNVLPVLADESLFIRDKVVALQHLSAWNSFISTSDIVWDIFRVIGWGLVLLLFSINQAFGAFFKFLMKSTGLFSILTKGDINSSPLSFWFLVGTGLVSITLLVGLVITGLQHTLGTKQSINQTFLNILKNATIVMLIPYILGAGFMAVQFLATTLGVTTPSTGNDHSIAAQIIGNNVIDIEAANYDDLPLVKDNPKGDADKTDSSPDLDPYRLIPMNGSTETKVGVSDSKDTNKFTKDNDIYKIDINSVVKNSNHESGKSDTSVNWIDEVNKNNPWGNFWGWMKGSQSGQNLIIYKTHNLESGEKPNEKKLESNPSFYYDARGSIIPATKAGIYYYKVSWLPIIIGEFAILGLYLFTFFKSLKVIWELSQLYILGIPTGMLKLSNDDGVRFLLDESIELLLSLCAVFINMSFFTYFAQWFGNLLQLWHASGMAQNLIKGLATPLALLAFAGFSFEDPRFWKASGASKSGIGAGVVGGIVGGGIMRKLTNPKMRGGGGGRVGGAVRSDLSNARARSAESNGGKPTIGGTLANLRAARGASFMAGKLGRSANAGIDAGKKYLEQAKPLTPGAKPTMKDKMGAGMAAMSTAASTPVKDAAASIGNGAQNFKKELTKNASVAMRSGSHQGTTEAVNRNVPNEMAQRRAALAKATPAERAKAQQTESHQGSGNSQVQRPSVNLNKTPPVNRPSAMSRPRPQITETAKRNTVEARNARRPESQSQVNLQPQPKPTKRPTPPNLNRRQ